MELITTTTCLTKNIGVNGNMFGGELMSLIDISAAAYASEMCKYPKLVTEKSSRKPQPFRVRMN